MSSLKRRSLHVITSMPTSATFSPLAHDSKRARTTFDFAENLSKVLPFLFVGSELVTEHELAEREITAIIDCRNQSEQDFRGPITSSTIINQQRLCLPLRDNNAEDASRYFYRAIHFIETVRAKGGRVLVHCTRGISRSCALVCAYLVWFKRQGYRDAIAELKERRAGANPNVSFSLQLVEFAQQQLTSRKMLAFQVKPATSEEESSGVMTEVLDANTAQAIMCQKPSTAALLLVDKSSRIVYARYDNASAKRAALHAAQTLVDLDLAGIIVHVAHGSMNNNNAGAVDEEEFQRALGQFEHSVCNV